MVDEMEIGAFTISKIDVDYFMIEWEMSDRTKAVKVCGRDLETLLSAAFIDAVVESDFFAEGEKDDACLLAGTYVWYKGPGEESWTNTRHLNQWRRKPKIEPGEWEMQPYLDMDAEIEIIEAKNEYGNIYDVPEEVIEAFKERWEEVTI